MENHATTCHYQGSIQMKLSKAQEASIKVMELGLIAGFTLGLPMIFAVLLLADLHTVLSIVFLLFLPVATALVGGLLGSLLFIVSTAIRFVLSK